MSLILESMVIGPILLNLICDIRRRLLHSVFMTLLGVFDIKTTGLNPLSSVLNSHSRVPIVRLNWNMSNFWLYRDSFLSKLVKDSRCAF